MARKRSKNLGDAEIKQIVEIIDGWSGKISWGLLIDAIELRMFNQYTRQALYKHERVRRAFEFRKADLSANDRRVRGGVSSQWQIALDRIARLEAANTRLESENTQLLEQFARWAYNAHTRGLDHDFLNRPLPPVNRGQTSRVNGR